MFEHPLLFWTKNIDINSLTKLLAPTAASASFFALWKAPLETIVLYVALFLVFSLITLVLLI